MANSSVPLIQVSPNAYYAVQAGVWFTAPAVTGPWTVAASVPDVIYTIPPSSPIYYVTYVRIYEATPQVVYVGYTPGYLGTVVGPDGTIVYGTGYAYDPWIGSVWYPPAYTYGIAAAPIYNPYVGYTFGFAMGLATAAWWGGAYYGGGAYYHPGYYGGYGCCASASANVYGHWGNAAYSGTRSWYAGGGVAGTDGQRQLCQRAHRHDRQLRGGQAVQRLDRQRLARLRPHRQHAGRRLGQRRARQQRQHLHRPAFVRVELVVHRRRWQLGRPHDGDDGGPAGRCACLADDDLQRQDRPDQHLGHGQSGQQRPLRRQQRQRDAQRRQRRLAAAFGERLGRGVGRHRRWADRESQARSAGDDRFGGFSDASRSRRLRSVAATASAGAAASAAAALAGGSAEVAASAAAASGAAAGSVR